jgi:hypothetical protein
MIRLTHILATLALLGGVGLWAAEGVAAPQSDSATAPKDDSPTADVRDVVADPRDTAEPPEFVPAPRHYKSRYAGGYPSKGPRNRGVLRNTCDSYPCGYWPSYYDMPPPIRPRVFYGYEPHRNGWPGYRHGWYRWDW